MSTAQTRALDYCKTLKREVLIKELRSVWRAAAAAAADDKSGAGGAISDSEAEP